MPPSKKTNIRDVDSISKRLKTLVDSLGVKQSYLASKLGLSSSGLHYILNNDVKFSKNAKKIADYLHVNEQWLATGKGDAYTKDLTAEPHAVPIFYPDQLKLFYRSQKKAAIIANAHFASTLAYASDAIGIYITETNFSPKFEIGDIVTFERTEQFKNGEILLIYFEKNNVVTLRHGFRNDDNIVIFDLNGQATMLSKQDGDLVIGVYRECLKRSNLL